MFLELMVAQLRYQDPMNPQDSGEFLAQSAQFTALEKMQDVADRTAELLGAQMAFGASAWSASTCPGLGRGRHDDQDRHHRRRHLRRDRPGLRHRRHRRAARRDPLRHRGVLLHLHPLPPLRRPDAPERKHHASLTLRRHQRPARQPDHARRDRQQHRQRQHHRLQGQHRRLPGHAQPDADRRRRRQRRPRRHQPDPGRPRRAGRRARTPTSTRAPRRPRAGRPT